MLTSDELLKLESDTDVYVSGYKRGGEHFGNYINVKPECGKIVHSFFHSESNQIYLIKVCFVNKKRRDIVLARYSYGREQLEFDDTYAVDLTLGNSVLSYNNKVQAELKRVNDYFEKIFNQIQNSFILKKPD